VRFFFSFQLVCNTISHDRDALSRQIQKQNGGWNFTRWLRARPLQLREVSSYPHLFIGIQNLNTQDASVDYFEQANLRLEDAILTLQLPLHSVWQSENSVLQDFKTIIEAVLTKVRFVSRVMTKYEKRNSFEATVSNSFVCPTTELTGAGRPVIVIERGQIEFLRELHFSWVKIASLLGISERTLRRRRRELNLNDESQNWTVLSGV